MENVIKKSCKFIRMTTQEFQGFVHSSVSSYFAAQEVHVALRQRYVNSFDYEGRRWHFYHVDRSTVKVAEGSGNTADVFIYPRSEHVKDLILRAAGNKLNLKDGTVMRIQKYKNEDRWKEPHILAEKRRLVQNYGDRHGVLIARRDIRGRQSYMDAMYHINAHTVHSSGYSDWEEDSPRKLEIIVLGNQPEALLKILHEL